MFGIPIVDKTTSQSITSVMDKNKISNFRIYWARYDSVNPWTGTIEYKNWWEEYKKNFARPTFQEVAEAMAEFSEKIINIEIQ